MATEFLQHFPKLRPEQVVIIPEGVELDAYAMEQSGEDVRKRFRLPEHFLFYPAQLWPHKDHMTIFRALLRLRARGFNLHLVLTGERYSGSDNLFRFLTKSGLGENVSYLGVISYSDIIALHRAARFLLTASLYEAGSIPILEAAAAGTPIIASAIPSHVEHSHDLQMQLFPPGDDEALAKVLERFWDDCSITKAQTESNVVTIAKFTWKKAAERYLDCFEAMHAGRKADWEAALLR